tara:strand:+ start:28 stop:525 length:498 start_codon:yes stop_codon:yes gene_type:complete
MDLIPIVKIPIQKDRWLEKMIKYENNLTIYNILENLAYDTYDWMYSNEELNILIDYNSFLELFINMIYSCYLLNNPIKYEKLYDDEELYEYFDLKYSDDINNLLLYFQEISKSVCLDLFLKSTDNYMDLFEFIYNNVEIMEDESLDDENTFNGDEIYSMSILSKC